MNAQIDFESAAQLATAIVVAYLDKNVVEPNQLPSLVRAVREALASHSPDAARAADLHDYRSPMNGFEPTTEMSEQANPGWRDVTGDASLISHTINDDFLVCLEDGGRFRSLRRHLKVQHGLTPEAYRAKWSLPEDYPMVAPSFAQERSAIAKRIKLGHFKRLPKPKTTSR